MSLSAALNTTRELLQQRSRSQVQHIQHLPDRTIINGYPSEKIYIPSKTGEAFALDNTFITLVIGPYGSGKSTMCVHKIVERACRMPIWSNGRRRSRWAIVRNTSGELQSTTLQTWLAWFGDLGDIRKREKPSLI